MFEILVGSIKIDDVEYLKNNTDIKKLDKQDGKNKFTLLHWAVLHKSLNCLKWLLQNKVNVNLKSDKGWTPVHIAAIKGHDECFKILLNNGADTSMKDSLEKTVGHLACSHGHSTILEIFLKKGQNMEHRDHFGWTAAHTSVYHGSLDCLKILITQGCDIEAIDNDGNNLIHLCCSEGKIDCLKVICNSARSIGILALLTLLQNPNDKGQTPKMVAKQNLNEICVKFIAKTIKSLTEKSANNVDSDVDAEENFHFLHFSNPESCSIEEKKCEFEDKENNHETKGPASPLKESVTSDVQIIKETGSSYINLSKEMLLATLEEKDRLIQKLNDYLEFERLKREKLEAQIDENRVYIRNLKLKLRNK